MPNHAVMMLVIVTFALAMKHKKKKNIDDEYLLYGDTTTVCLDMRSTAQHRFGKMKKGN